MTNKETSVDFGNNLFDKLENIHCELVAARKIAALSKDKSYDEIGLALDHVENAITLIYKF